MNKSVRNRLIVCLIAALAGILVDHATKRWAVAALKDASAIDLIPQVLQFTYVENRGAAFGMLQGQQVLFYILTAVILTAILCLLVKIPAQRSYLPAVGCLTAVASGAVGNLIDRVSQSYVVDFIYFMPIDFPVFNVADIFVTCGMGLLIVLMLFFYKEEDLEFIK